MTDEDRVTCATCRNQRAGWCLNAVAAGLAMRNQREQIPRSMIDQPQRCPAHSPIVQTRSQAMRDAGFTRRPTAKRLPSDE